MKKLMMLLCLVPLAAMADQSTDDSKQCDDKSHHYKMKHNKSGDVPFYLQNLDLTDTQKAQIKGMMEKRYQDRKANKKVYWENKKAVMELTQAETLDETELEKQVEASLAMKKTSAMERARLHHQLYHLLTEKQQQQLDARMAAFGKKYNH